MASWRRWQGLIAGGLGCVLTALTGCNTWVPGVGQTLPSPHYLDIPHLPQYTPPTMTVCPLPNETDGLYRANERAARFAPVGGPPAPLVPGGMGPGPVPPGPVGPGPGMPGPPMPPLPPGQGVPGGIPGMP
jgi:hypothetical protein